MAGRARNLVHRSGVLVSVGGVSFVVAFALLLWFTRAEREALQRVPTPVDTLDLARKAASMRRLQFRADSVLAVVSPPRRPALRRLPVVDSSAVDSTTAARDSAGTDSLAAAAPAAAAAPEADPPAVSASAGISDSLRLAVATLSARLERAQNAPLASSWRALAADPLMQQDARVRALADSLAEAEKSRNEYDAVGGVDPIYLELSSRVTSYGRAIERSALQRIAALLQPSAALGPASALRVGPTAEERARRFVADSARYVTARAKRDAAALVSDSVNALLAVERAMALARDSARARAQRRVDALAPPAAMLTASAAAAIGLALLVTILLEVQSPRFADDREVASQARVPVLLSIRATDARTPEALTSAFSQLAFDLEPFLVSVRTLIVVSDDAQLASRTAARMGERLGYDGRSVRIVSPRQGTARMTTRVRRRATPTATQAVLVQPERNQGVAWTGEFFLENVTDDTITLRSGTLDDVRPALAAGAGDSHVVLVVQIGSTPSAWLSRARAEIHRTRGLSAFGVVIWAADIEDSDPIQFALDTALQRALDNVPVANR